MMNGLRSNLHKIHIKMLKPEHAKVQQNEKDKTTLWQERDKRAKYIKSTFFSYLQIVLSHI